MQGCLVFQHLPGAHRPHPAGSACRRALAARCSAAAAATDLASSLQQIEPQLVRPSARHARQAAPATR